MKSYKSSNDQCLRMKMEDPKGVSEKHSIFHGLFPYKQCYPQLIMIAYRIDSEDDWWTSSLFL
jgi:hypothetical protein